MNDTNVSQIHVLSVDDEPDLCIISKDFLESFWDMRVDVVFSATEALEALKEKKYDAIVSDYQMPEIDGIHFARILRQQNDRTPFILFTGKGREDVVIEAMDSGVDGYVQKGTDIKSAFAELAFKIRNAVTRVRAELAMEESEARYRTMIDGSSVGIFLTDLNGDSTYSNPRWLEMTGLDKDGALGKGWMQGVHLDDRRSLERRWEAAISGAKQIMFEYRYRRGRRTYWIVGNLVPVRESNGRINGFLSTNVDITERKRAEEAVLEKERAIAKVSSMAKMGYWVWKANEAEVVFSDGLSKLLLIEPGAVLPHDTFFNMVHPGDQSKVIDALEQAMKRVGEPGLDHRMVRSDRSIITVHTTIEVTTASGNRPVYILGMVRDITDQERMERKAREMEDLHRIVFETIAEGIIVRSAEGKIILCNDQAATMFGYPSAEELVIHDVAEGRVVQEDGTPCSLKDFPSRTAFRTESATQGHICGIRGAGEKTTWVSVNTRPYMVKGVPQAAVVSFSDVTSKLQSERQMRDSERRFKLITDNMSDVINVLGLDLRFTYLSPSVEKLRGFTVDECMGQTLQEVFTPDSLKIAMSILSEEMEAEKAGSKPLDRVRYAELEEYRKDGSTVWVGNAMRFLRDEGGKAVGLLVLARDATEARASMQALYEANSKLALLSRLTRHDIMNQLQVINGWLELMRLEGRKEIEMRDKALKALVNTRSLIEFSAEYEKLGAITPYYIEVRREVERMAIAVPTSTLRLENEMGPEMVLADPMLHKVFYNLVENAVRHAKDATFIRFRSEVRDGTLRMITEDDGPGVNVNDKEQIFQRGFGQNTGDGLFFVRTILAITGMTIHEEGTPGKGARFVITVPEGNWRA